MTYSESQQTKNLEQIMLLHDNSSKENDENIRTRIVHAIVSAMAVALFRDLQKQLGQRIDDENLGWRNKYNIHRLSGVSQKHIYKECGIIEQLIEMKIMDRRPAPSRWGQQKHQYRLNLSRIVEEDDVLGSLGLE